MSLSAIAPKATVSPSAATPTASPTGTGAGSAAFDSVLNQLRGSTGTAGVPGAGATTGGAGTTGRAGEDATEDRFLKLLVAQMKNQDPLNPLDNAQVTTQLAQINTVKGIDKLNTSLQTLVDGSKQGRDTHGGLFSLSEPEVRTRNGLRQRSSLPKDPRRARAPGAHRQGRRVPDEGGDAEAHGGGGRELRALPVPRRARRRRLRAVQRLPAAVRRA
jgi:hypothetical protein